MTEEIELLAGWYVSGGAALCRKLQRSVKTSAEMEVM